MMPVSNRLDRWGSGTFQKGLGIPDSKKPALRSWRVMQERLLEFCTICDESMAVGDSFNFWSCCARCCNNGDLPDPDRSGQQLLFLLWDPVVRSTAETAESCLGCPSRISLLSAGVAYSRRCLYDSADLQRWQEEHRPSSPV